MYFAPVHIWGTAGADQALTASAFAALQVEWFLKMLALGYKVDLIPKRTTIACMVFKPDSELYDAFGNVYNCTEVSHVEAYNIRNGDSSTTTNKYAIGAVDNHIRSDDLPFTNFYDEVSSGAYQCSKCQIFPVCGGKCPKSWQEGNIPCPPEKFNLPQRLIIKDLISNRATKIVGAHKAVT
ncbi:hypothetical protein GCM10007890_50400 [Methylobacterium tardum]|uniref:SPASM domain-containing protein n=1 Tax=Methylobacterium tardum TaxID=374432 RepID=A0AA37TGG5_9HYPH|nr:hypothetical protein GCM10007890_50400 [Methylobacterium tardum]